LDIEGQVVVFGRELIDGAVLDEAGIGEKHIDLALRALDRRI